MGISSALRRALLVVATLTISPAAWAAPVPCKISDLKGSWDLYFLVDTSVQSDAQMCELTISDDGTFTGYCMRFSEAGIQTFDGTVNSIDRRCRFQAVGLTQILGFEEGCSVRGSLTADKRSAAGFGRCGDWQEGDSTARFLFNLIWRRP